MRILFLHRNFPGQFLHLLQHLAKNRRHEVAFITANNDTRLPGVRIAVYPSPKPPDPREHRYLRFAADSVAHGQGAANAALALKRLGFIPDVIVGHSWGPMLFMKDLFPDVPLLGYFEWFYNLRGSDIDFDGSVELTPDFAAATRSKNAPILMDLSSCDRGITPTGWQLAQFPKIFHSKLVVLHDGIDTGYFRPAPREAAQKLRDDIVAKTDGCDSTGAADKNDWLTDCSAQSVLYPLLQNVLDILQ